MNHSEAFQFAKCAVTFNGIRFLGKSKYIKSFAPELRAAKARELEGYLSKGVKGISNRKSKRIFIAKPEGYDNARNHIAHEAFHQVPLLGRSETLARFVGGYREPRLGRHFGWDEEKVTYGTKIRNGLYDVKNYARSMQRPIGQELYPGGHLGKLLSRVIK
jgi:hypothetical protein